MCAHARCMCTRAWAHINVSCGLWERVRIWVWIRVSVGVWVCRRCVHGVCSSACVCTRVLRLYVYFNKGVYDYVCCNASVQCSCTCLNCPVCICNVGQCILHSARAMYAFTKLPVRISTLYLFIRDPAEGREWLAGHLQADPGNSQLHPCIDQDVASQNLTWPQRRYLRAPIRKELQGPFGSFYWTAITSSILQPCRHTPSPVVSPLNPFDPASTLRDPSTLSSQDYGVPQPHHGHPPAHEARKGQWRLCWGGVQGLCYLFCMLWCLLYIMVHGCLVRSTYLCMVYISTAMHMRCVICMRHWFYWLLGLIIPITMLLFVCWCWLSCYILCYTFRGERQLPVF